MAHVPASERRPQLIRAAIDLMSREGVAAGSTRAIAAELGVAQATVHYTFGTKKDLYRAVTEQLMADFIEQVHAASPGDGPFGEQVRTLVHALWTSTVAEPGRCILLAEVETLAMRDPELQEIIRGLQGETERIAAAMLTALADAHGLTLALPAREVAIQFLAGFDGLCGRHLVLRADHAEPDEEALRALDLLVATTVGLCLGTPARAA
ncbi:TetR family transcriptional regulator [Streptomyces sp. CB01881]|uniref:TetR/AcrR family transcriptional regulator n=1 Tax=Streptomyces sp. CB01881 TaxID=2078691 RepID=UPI000CDC743F|nr:TetR family transcriptional regulator [Streptomyces sp. CB01881]AUY50019.1 TetR family transcriptional regulator [Streptomyces sp. CB01881]TYC73416.1 TetR/AcrR family transcriptional regulator [Streptomyces sp. CB01881]